MTANLRLMARRWFDVPAVVLEPGVKSGMPILYDNPKEVGADRIANAVGAHDLFGGPCVVVDLGTATTFDAISAAGEYLGGAITPGVAISLDALFANAAALRRVELVEPRSVIGKSTVESIQSGALYGFAGQVDGLCRRFAAVLGECTVVATGGLSELISPYSEEIEYVEPWLTLHGLRIIFERNSPGPSSSGPDGHRAAGVQTGASRARRGRAGRVAGGPTDRPPGRSRTVAEGWVVPSVDPLQRVVVEVVELALGAVVGRPGQVGRAHPVVPHDGAQVDVGPEQLAVPFGEHPLEAPGVGIGVVDGQRAPLHPLRGLDPGDGAEGRGQVDQAHRRDTTAGAVAPDGAGRQTRGSRMRASTWYGPLNSSPKSPCSSPWSVVKTTSRSSAHPRSAMRPSTRPTASSMSSHSTALRALTSRTWSGVRVAGTQSAGAS